MTTETGMLIFEALLINKIRITGGLEPQFCIYIKTNSASQQKITIINQQFFQGGPISTMGPGPWVGPSY